MSPTPTPTRDNPDAGIGPARRPVSEARRAHLRAAGRLGNEKRRTLTAGEVQDLARAFDLLRGIARRHGLDLDDGRA